MAELKEKIAELKHELYKITELVKEIQKEEGITLTFAVSSEKKTVEVVSASTFEISCKATINQEL